MSYQKSLLQIIGVTLVTLPLVGCGPSEAEKHFNQAVNYSERGEFELAIDEFDQAIALDTSASCPLAREWDRIRQYFSQCT